MTIFTIGYEKLSIDAFLSLLTENEIDIIVDVRELPLSRKPNFSKQCLANTLRVSGREYIHMASLGCPKVIRHRYRDDGDWTRYTEAFLGYLRSQSSQIAVLSKLTASSRCALLCYEADHNFCHRSMVADAVHASCGTDIHHIDIARARIAIPAPRQIAFS